MKVYVMRHGETGWNAQWRCQGRSDIPLNEKGREMARITAEGLKDIVFDKVYCSPLCRAFETATIVTQGRGLDITKDDRLIEIDFGECEGMFFDDVNTMKDSPMYDFLHNTDRYVAPKGGESFEDVMARARDFMKNELVQLEGKYENVLIVAHGCFNRMMAAVIGGYSLEHLWDRATYHNCCVNLLEVTDGEIRMLEEAKVYYDI